MVEILELIVGMRLDQIILDPDALHAYISHLASDYVDGNIEKIRDQAKSHIEDLEKVDD